MYYILLLCLPNPKRIASREENRLKDNLEGNCFSTSRTFSLSTASLILYNVCYLTILFLRTFGNPRVLLIIFKQREQLQKF